MRIACRAHAMRIVFRNAIAMLLTITITYIKKTNTIVLAKKKFVLKV